MAANNHRRNNTRNQGQDDEGPGWLGLLGAAVGVGAAIGGAYLLSRALSEDSEQPSTPQRQRERQTARVQESEYFSSRNNWSSSSALESQTEIDEDLRITISVDATKEGLGGLLKIPKLKKIFYYSEKWNPFYVFPDEPDKFEMINALVALTKFHNTVLNYKERDPIIVKIDNNFYNSNYRDIEDKELLNFTCNKLRSCEGDWKYVTAPGDKDMKIADRLSRNRDFTILMMESYPEPDYDFCQVDVHQTLEQLRHVIPEKYYAI